jgi:hypothetical protein
VPAPGASNVAKVPQAEREKPCITGAAKIYPDEKIEPMSDAYHALQAQADHYADTGQTQKAIDMYQQLLEKLRAWGPKPDEDLRDATCISGTWTALADLLRRVGRTDEAGRLESAEHDWSSNCDARPS